MSKLVSLTNRLKNIESHLPPKKDKLNYFIDNGHINLSDNNYCLLCGKEVDKNTVCPKRLSNQELHEFMADKEEDFILFIWHKNVNSDMEQEYTGFVSIPDYCNSSEVSVKIYDRKL
jgi:hypothetical protein